MCCIGTQAWPRARPRPADRGGRVVASGPLLKRSHSVPLPSIHEVSDELGKARAGDQATSAPPGRGPLPHPEHSRVSGPPSPGAPCLRSGSLGGQLPAPPHCPCRALPPAPVRAPVRPHPRGRGQRALLSPWPCRRQELPPARPPPRLAPGSRRPGCSLPCSSVTCRRPCPRAFLHGTFPVTSACLSALQSPPARPLTRWARPPPEACPLTLPACPLLGAHGCLVGWHRFSCVPRGGPAPAFPARRRPARSGAPMLTRRSLRRPRVGFPRSRLLPAGRAPLPRAPRASRRSQLPLACPRCAW